MSRFAASPLTGIANLRVESVCDKYGPNGDWLRRSIFDARDKMRAILLYLAYGRSAVAVTEEP